MDSPYGEPWRVKVNGAFAEDGTAIAGIWVESGEWRSICSVIPHGDVRATANLIAAAPDLLAACKKVVEHYGDPASGELFGLRAAIAKAEGK